MMRVVQEWVCSERVGRGRKVEGGREGGREGGKEGGREGLLDART